MKGFLVQICDQFVDQLGFGGVFGEDLLEDWVIWDFVYHCVGDEGFDAFEEQIVVLVVVGLFY